MSNILTDEETIQQWLVLLSFLQTEINDLKVAFSRVLSKEFSAALLVRMESFQTHLLDHDAAIAVLRHELSISMEKIKKSDLDINSAAIQPIQDTSQHIELMCNEIEKLKNQLSKYTTAFSGSDFIWRP